MYVYCSGRNSYVDGKNISIILYALESAAGGSSSVGGGTVEDQVTSVESEDTMQHSATGGAGRRW